MRAIEKIEDLLKSSYEMIFVLEFKSSILSINPARSLLDQRVLRLKSWIDVFLHNVLNQIIHIFLFVVCIFLIYSSKGKHESLDRLVFTGKLLKITLDCLKEIQKVGGGKLVLFLSILKNTYLLDQD